MNIIIAGAGEVGGYAADVLSSAGHNVTVIDLSEERLQTVGDLLDVRTLEGHTAHLDILREAGCDRCDLLIAATDFDETNLLTAVLAKILGTKKTIVRVHHTANYSLRGTTVAQALGIDEFLCPEHLTSLEIGRAIRNPGSVALEEFAQGRLLMQRFVVTEGAPAVGKKLAEVELPASIRVTTVESDTGPCIAHAGTIVSAGDYVTILAETKSLDIARKQFNKEKEKRMHVAIMGESSTAVWLCRVLKSRLFTVRLFVEHQDRAEELSEKLEHVTVLVGDPTDKSTFADEHLSEADVFIAVTRDDEDNILAAAHAKAHGTAMVIAVVQRPKYLPLFEHIRIDSAFSPRQVAVRSILKLIDVRPVRSVATFADDIAEVYQIHPTKRSKVIGRELRHIKLPSMTMIAAIRRGDEVHVPGADDQVRADDTLLVIGPVGIRDELQVIFAKK